MKKKALVTGGAGFIGSHLTRKLLKNGWDVLVVDNLITGFKSNVSEDAEFLEADVSNEKILKELPENGVDVVFHLAAQTSGEISFDNPAYDLKTNCLSTILLLSWCAEKNIDRFIYASSMSIYGDVETLPVKENAFPKPKSFYGIGKMASENYLRLYKSYGINSTALRYFNVYGPGQNMENLRQGMVSIYMTYINNNKTVIVKGSKDRFRDLIYIDDIISATLSVIDKPVTFGEIYNVATGKKTHVYDLLNNILEAFTYDPDTYPIDYVEDTPGDQFGIYADISKIEKHIGWKPKIENKEGIKKMANWVKNKDKQSYI